MSKIEIKARTDKGSRPGARQAVFYALKPGSLRPERIRLNVPPALTDAAARKWAESVKRAIERGEPVPQLREGRKALAAAKAEREQQEAAAAREAITVAEWVEQYLADCAARRVRQNSIVTTRQQLHRLLEVAGGRRVADFGELDFAKLRRALAGCATSTANSIQALAYRVLAAAAKAGLRGPIERPAKIRREAEVRDGEEEEGDARPEHYTVAELERLVAAAARLGEHHLAVVLLGGDAGLRAGEIAGLKAADIEPSGEIHVRRTIAWIEGQRVVHLPKSGKSRRVPATPRLLQALAVLAETSPDGWLLRGPGDRQPAASFTVAAYNEAVCKAAGLVVRGPHKLRHTFASHQADAGTPIRRLQALLGHASLRQTERYVHADREGQREAADRLARWRAEQAGTAVTQAISVVRLCGTSGRGD